MNFLKKKKLNLVFGSFILILMVLFLSTNIRWNGVLHDESVSEYGLNGYAEENGVFTNLVGDANIQLPQLNKYVETIGISFGQPLDNEMSITVYYAEDTHGYSEEYTSSITTDNEVIYYIPIEKEITTCRIDIGTVSGQNFMLQQIMLNPSQKQPIELTLIPFGILATVILWVVALFLSDRGSKYLRAKFSEYMLTNTEYIYLLLCFVIYFLWSITFVIYPEYGPDEVMRYDIPKFIFETGTLPYGWEESIRHPAYGFSYGFDISLPYLLSALFMKITSLFTVSDTALFISARFTSVLSSVGVVYYSILISRKLKGTSPIRWIFIFLMSLTPQIVFLASYVNLDSFSLFTVMVIIYAWLRGIEDSWSRSSCTILAVGMGLCFLSYKFAYSFILASFFLYCLWHWSNRKEISFKLFFRHGIYIALIVFVICGWKFIRNAILYNGDFLALNASNPYAELYAADWLKPSMRVTYTYRYKGLSILDMLQDSVWLDSTYKSLFSVVGSMCIFADQWVYSGYTFLVSIGFVGSIGYLLQQKSRKTNIDNISKNKIFLIGSTIFASIITVVISLYMSWSMDFQPQGRYIICILPGLYLMVMFGFDFLLRMFRGYKSFMNVLTVCAIFGFTILSMLEAYINVLNFYVY